MAKAVKTREDTDPFARATPRWPTTMRTRLRDGRVVGVPGAGVWLYKKIPLTAVQDAKSIERQINASTPLLSAFEVLSESTQLRGGNRRQMVRSAYRQVHVLLVNVPSWFSPPHDHPRQRHLAEDHGREIIDNRVLLFGVRLRDSLLGSGGGVRGAVDSAMESIVKGDTPLQDFDLDYRRMDAALSRAGLVTPTTADLRLAEAWFNFGGAPDPTIYPDVNNLAVFNKPSEAQHAARHLKDTPIEEWPQTDGHRVFSFAALQDLELDYVPATDRRALWGAELIDAEAAAISVRCLIEPQKITRKEVEAQQKRYTEDIRERLKNNKIDRDEQQAMLEELKQINALYGSGRAPATLVDTSVVVAFNGVVEDWDTVVAGSAMTLVPLSHRQPASLAETWLCSNVRANPHLMDLPSTSLGYAGLMALSRVGDAPKNGAALLGFTERDRQPSWFDPRAPYEQAEVAPLVLCAGASGSGKSVLMLHLADQLGGAGTPVIVIDPKVDSDHSDAVENSGGQVVSLDQLLSADGVFDPLRLGISRESAVDMAVSMLQEVNPWGTMKADYETPINVALSYGVDHGASCIGEALTIALRDGRAPKDMVDAVLELAEANPHFRAMCGLSPQSEALRVADGITYIRVGKSGLVLPEPGAQGLGLSQRIAINLVRLMVAGSATALTGRKGVVMLDEAWVFLGSGNSELERLARVARSQTVTVMMFTQRVSDATVAGIDEHIAEGLVLPLKKSEAYAACEILGIEATDERIARITAGATVGDSHEDGELQPNWDSMRALHRPGTREVIRGTIAYFADLNDRVVPVEITIPRSFLEKASTNWQDIARRERMKEAASSATASSSVTASSAALAGVDAA